MNNRLDGSYVQRNSILAVFSAVFFLTALAGCGGQPETAGTPASPPKIETIGGPKSETVGGEKSEDAISDVASTSQPLVSGGLYDIGVIPSSASCPAGSELIEIHMDDEDSHNANSAWGWIGATTQTANTTLRFCRVPGDQFLPLAQNNDVRNHYAVLKLGTYCPPFSEDFGRYFDNEDSGTSNWVNGNISPSWQAGNTQLRFCLFRYGSVTMSSFPLLEGLSYGVLASGYFDPVANSSLPIAAGHIHIDDEDSGNRNGYAGATTILNEAQLIVSGGPNTDIGFARVR